MKRPVVLLVLSSLLLAACASALTPTDTPVPLATVKPRTVVVDTDMAVDDWLAILYLLQRSDVNVAAITVTGAGEAHCGPGTRNALGLVALAGGEDIPVACGRETPLQGDHTFPKDWRQAVDGLLGLTLPESTNAVSDQTAVELLTSIISSSPHQKVILLTLGPLTNVAEALQAAPALVDNLEMVYIMGGAVDVRGNIASSGVGIDNEVAEWNIYVDPAAARVVLESGVPITLVPLDATNQVPLTLAFYNRIEDNHTSPEASFVFDVLTRMYGFVESGGYYFWDPLTAAILTDGSLADFQTRRLVVVEAEGPESGRTRPAQGGVEVRVAVSVDGPRFEEVFLDTLNGQFPRAGN